MWMKTDTGCLGIGAARVQLHPRMPAHKAHTHTRARGLGLVWLLLEERLRRAQGGAPSIVGRARSHMCALQPPDLTIAF